MNTFREAPGLQIPRKINMKSKKVCKVGKTKYLKFMSNEQNQINVNTKKISQHPKYLIFYWEIKSSTYNPVKIRMIPKFPK